MTPQQIEDLTTRAHLASELRLLEFSEYAIKNILELREVDVEQIIIKYKNALDLMGDDSE